MTRVLSIEDEAIDREWILRSLDDWQVVFAKGFGDASEILKQETFDVILADMMVPDGFRGYALENIRLLKTQTETPVLIVTGLIEIPNSSIPHFTKSSNPEVTLKQWIQQQLNIT